jgi:hypothetical protein
MEEGGHNQFKGLSLQFPRQTEENNENPRSGYQKFWRNSQI